MRFLILPAFLLSFGFLAAASPTGAETFKSKCAMCHGQDASGSTPMGKKLNLKDLRGAEVQAKSDAQLTEAISKGKAPMPAYEKMLSAAEIQDLVKYIRSIKN